MSELDDLLSDAQKGLLLKLGEEGLEQFNLDEMWLRDTFRTNLFGNISGCAKLQQVGADSVYIINSAFLSGMVAYRQFMIEHGVDVLALEGRV